MTEGTTSQVGLSIVYTDPLARSDRDAQERRFDPQMVTSYTHTIAAFGGFESAEIVVNMSRQQTEEFFNEGLGTDIRVYDETLSLVWEGFVNEIEIVYGPLTKTRGPLTSVGNRVYAVYAPIDATTAPPTIGARTITVAADNTFSQDKYGIWEKVLSVGQRLAAEATNERDTYLKEHANPETSENLALGSGGTNMPKITLRCKGYYYWFDAYVYDYTATQASVTIYDKLLAVVVADTNAIISTDYTGMDANATLVNEYENDDMMGLSLIKSLVALGDASYNRHLFGVYENRRVIYAAAPTAAEYRLRLGDSFQGLQTITGAPVAPWQARPGRWIYFSDFMTGKSYSTDLRQNPQFLFAESVTYTAPWGLQISGGKIYRLDQILAQRSLEGITA